MHQTKARRFTFIFFFTFVISYLLIIVLDRFSCQVLADTARQSKFSQPSTILLDAVAPLSGTLPFSGTFDMSLSRGIHLETASQSELDVGGESLTIEAWIKLPDNFTGTVYIVNKPEAYRMWVRGAGQYQYLGFRGSEVLAGGNDVGLDPPGWHHIAAVFNQQDEWTEMSVDGHTFSHGTTIPWTPLPNSSEPLKVGQGKIGEIDELRISSVVRYAVGGIGDFPVPTAPFECDTETRTLWHFDESIIATTFQDSCGTNNTLSLIYANYLPLITK